MDVASRDSSIQIATLAGYGLWRVNGESVTDDVYGRERFPLFRIIW